jgi:hypothetical protein
MRSFSPSIAVSPDLSVLNDLRSYTQASPEEEVVLNILRREFLWNPHHDSPNAMIEAALGQLLNISPVWTPDKIRFWLHRNGVTWGHQTTNSPHWGQQIRSPRKSPQRSPVPGGRRVAPETPPAPRLLPDRPPEDPREALARGAVREIIERIQSSISHWKRPTDVGEEEHPELTAFVTFRVAEHFRGQMHELTNKICEFHKDTLMILMDKEASQRLNDRRMAQVREARNVHQERRKGVFRMAGERLNKWRELLRSPPELDEEVDSALITVLDGAVVDDCLSFTGDKGLAVRFLGELNRLASLSPREMASLNYDDFPTLLQFAFLLSSTCAASLRLARLFMHLPCQKTVYNKYKRTMKDTKSGLSDLQNLDRQIDTFIGMNHLPNEEPVSVAVDAMAMSPDRAYLPGKNADYSFVIYGQPLNRQYRCLPLHVIPAKSGNATKDVQKVVDEVCERLTNRGLVVKYLCSDGDAGYNDYHRKFFEEWYVQYLNGGLEEALAYARTHTKLPVGDFLHLWKLFCNRVKNHDVTLTPDTPGPFSLSGDTLEMILNLGAALRDRSSIGKMRDSYPLQLFSLESCLKCLQEDRPNELMYLLPWALQEEVIRSPTLTRQERLDKAVLSFEILIHYFHLSFLPYCMSVTKRFDKEITTHLTFADDMGWLRVLNSTLCLIEFITSGNENWSFSRLGTHCLENFFGLIRRNARGDDRLSRAIQIITRGTVAVGIMEELHVHSHIRGRDNVGGTVIGQGSLQSSEIDVERIYHSFLAHAGLHDDAPDPSVLLNRDQLIELLTQWCQKDDHHKTDPGRKADFTKSIANHGIVARNQRRKA